MGEELEVPEGHQKISLLRYLISGKSSQRSCSEGWSLMRWSVESAVAWSQGVHTLHCCWSQADAAPNFVDQFPLFLSCCPGSSANSSLMSKQLFGFKDVKCATIIYSLRYCAVLLYVGAVCRVTCRGIQCVDLIPLDLSWVCSGTG